MVSTLPNHYPEFIHWTWPQFEPYYQDLIERSLSADNDAAWLADWTHLGKLVDELQARLSLANRLNTADAEAERRYLAFLSEVFPQVHAAEQKLKQKLLDSRLEPEGFEIPLRNMHAEAALFREANLLLLVEERKLGTHYDKIVGAQSIQWNGQELTMQQVRTVLHDPDRAAREHAWRLASERWRADRAAIDEV